MHFSWLVRNWIPGVNCRSFSLLELSLTQLWTMQKKKNKKKKRKSQILTDGLTNTIDFVIYPKTTSPSDLFSAHCCRCPLSLTGARSGRSASSIDVDSMLVLSDLSLSPSASGLTSLSFFVCVCVCVWIFFFQIFGHLVWVND